MPRLTIDAPEAPAPIGPYSVASCAPGASLLFLSGQTPVDPETGRLKEGGIEAQTRQAFSNLEAVLRVAGLSMDDVVKVNVYLTTMADFAGMNQVYGGVFAPPYPARTTVAVHQLPLDALVEIEMVVAIQAHPEADT